MFDCTDDYPDWLLEQRGKRYRAANQRGVYFKRSTLIVKYARHLKAQAKPVTHDAIRAMLRFVERDYSMHADQISAALAGLYANGTIPKMPNGRPIVIDGQNFPSARSAAEALGISPQTVLNRIASARPKWDGWTYETVLGTVPVATDTE